MRLPLWGQAWPVAFGPFSLGDGSREIALLLVHSGFRIIALLVGLTFAYWGYRLFRVGVLDHEGELKALYGKGSLLLRRAAPGTFFALFGAIVVVVALFRGLEIRTGSSSIDRPTRQLIEKAVAGQNLEPNERQALKQWLDANPPVVPGLFEGLFGNMPPGQRDDPFGVKGPEIKG